MQTLSISDTQAQTIEAARNEAVAKARQSLEQPVVLSWRNDRDGRIAPDIPGAATEDRWRDYGVSNGGQLEVNVGHDFHFILADAANFEEPDLHFANLRDEQGTTFFCVREACTEEDRRALGEAEFGGGTGGG